MAAPPPAPWLRQAAQATWRRLGPRHAPEHGQQPLPTGDARVDGQLAGGLQRGALTELFGPSASGKTQACLGACARAALAGEDVVFVDAARGFSAKRLLALMLDTGADQEAARQAMAERVVVVPAPDVPSLVRTLDALADCDGPIALVVLDSAASLLAPIVGGSKNYASALVQQVGLHLRRVASSTGAAVVVTNHAVRVPGCDNAPALGAAWRDIPRYRVNAR